MHAAVEDAGRYTCIVSNSAGEERKNFDLDILGKDMINILYFGILLDGIMLNENVQIMFNECGDSENHVIDFQSNSTVPPSIVDEGTVVDTKVKEKHNITLTCEASGN